MGYQPSYGFLKDCLYRSESYKVTLADAYDTVTYYLTRMGVIALPDSPPLKIQERALHFSAPGNP